MNPPPTALAGRTAVAVLVALLAACSDSGPVTPPPDLASLDALLPADALPADGTPEGSRDQAAADLDDPAACQAGPALLARVDPGRMKADLLALINLGERHSEAGQAKAAQYLESQLSPLGLQLRSQSYVFGGASFRNLEATLPGQLGDLFLFAGAHYDSISSATTDAPGADDNASGTVAVLEAARALAGCRFRRTIRFLFFSKEEDGRVGSRKYVQEQKPLLPADQLLGYLNLDMVGWARRGEDLDLVTRPAHATLVDSTAAAINKWTALPLRKVVGDACG